jgi:Dienelactone hydrolase family
MSDSVFRERLVCHGAVDPHVPTEHVARLIAEMNAAGADWQLIVYGNAMHGVTHDIGPALPGVTYNSAVDRRSFAAIPALLKEIFEGSSRSEQPVRLIPVGTTRGPGTVGGPEVGVTRGCSPSPPDQRFFPQRTTSATPNATASRT